MECTVVKVDRDYRIVLPQSLLKHSPWIAGNGPLKGWLVVGGPGRCRLLSADEFDNDPGCQSLRASIDEEAGQRASSAIEFDDEASAVLSLRLFQIDIAPPGPGWRLALPRALAAIMQIRPKETSIALLFSQPHIEIWTLETLRAAVAKPLDELKYR